MPDTVPDTVPVALLLSLAAIEPFKRIVMQETAILASFVSLATRWRCLLLFLENYYYGALNDDLRSTLV